MMKAKAKVKAKAPHKPKSTLNWKRIWRRFEAWEEAATDPNWENTQTTIQNLVEQELTRKERK